MKTTWGELLDSIPRDRPDDMSHAAACYARDSTAAMLAVLLFELDHAMTQDGIAGVSRAIDQRQRELVQWMDKQISMKS